MANRSFKILEGSLSTSSSSISTPTNWNLCIICQAETSENLNCPALSNRKDVGSRYKSIAAHLRRFGELGLLPRTLQLDRLDDGDGIEETLTKHKASWHPSCRARYNTTKLKRAEKRPIESDISKHDSSSEKRTRAQTDISDFHRQETCFFCGKGSDDSKKLHKAATFQVDQQVRRAAAVVKDTELLAKLSAGDMVALDAVYHSQCLVTLYNRARKESQVMNSENSSERAVAGIVFAELVSYIEDSRANPDESPVFKLADLVSLYQSRMEQLGVQTEQRIHSTRLKERLLSHIPDLQAHRSGRDVLLAFQHDVGDALAQMCFQDDDDQGILLAKSAKLVREKLFSDNHPFNGTFSSSSKSESVPEVLVALISMILEGPGIKEQTKEITLSAARSIAELVKYNAVKHKRSPVNVAEKSSRHSMHQETPLPIYLGLLVHAETRKKGMVDKLHSLGLSISYDRVLRLSSEMGNSVVESYMLDGVVCPKSLRRNVFTTAAVDNIDHNPSATTAKDSFHGTSISILQHQSSESEGEALGGILISGASRSKSVGHLPSYYTHVPPVDSNVKGTAIPEGHISSIEYHEAVYRGAQIYANEEIDWLDHVASNISKEDDSSAFGVSWSNFHARKQPQVLQAITRSALLPLFQESAHTVAMIRHSIDVTRQVIGHLNPYQTPVLTFDQPLYALAKQIQWKWPQNYGEDQFLAMLGGLHIEMAYQKTIGDWLQGSGWVSAIEQAGIASSGTAESFLKASHLSRTRRMHQVSAAALHLAKRHAYEEYHDAISAENEDPLSFEEWQNDKEANIPQFKYWNTVLEMQLLLNILVRSLRISDYQMYIDSLVEIASWFFAMNHTNYARWLPVHIRDLKQLGAQHPAVEDAFKAGKFTVKKTQRRFSAIPIDQAHEQNNKIIKGDGGAVGLTENPSALRRWMVAGPEVARVILEYEELLHGRDSVSSYLHHDETAGVNKAFQKDVASFFNTIKELGNPFEEESKDLIALDTKRITDQESVANLYKAKGIGTEQLDTFIKDRLVNRSKPIDDPITRNKLAIFASPCKRKTAKSGVQLKSMKSDLELFSRMYISCQTREGNLDEFFKYENQPFPPALTDETGSLRLGSKSDLLQCLVGDDDDSDENENVHVEPVNATAIILDGAAIVQMLKPGTSKTFKEYSEQVFLPYVKSQLQKANRIDITWDRYFTDSLKGTARAKRGKGIRRRVIDSTACPTNWANFLRVDENKIELFKLLTESLIVADFIQGKELFVTDGEQVVCVPNQDTAILSPCNHEEADTRMLLHASHAASKGHNSIIIRTVDTDVLVLAVMVAEKVPEIQQLWLAFGNGKNFRYIAAHRIKDTIGPQKSLALPMFHALTGCDTVSAFANHGKKSAWATWECFPDLTDALIALASCPEMISMEVMNTIQRFVVLMYDRASQCIEINKARKKIFARCNNVKRIPPTYDALEQHVKRAAFQGGFIWINTLEKQPELPSPCDWGWRKDDSGLYEPHWTNLPDASKACKELISCKCKKGCKKGCKCKKADLQCTQLCFCEGDCERQ